jgi:hypothetical protein
MSGQARLVTAATGCAELFARPGQARPGQPGQPGQARPGQARLCGQARPGQAASGQARPGQARPGQAIPGQASHTGRARPGRHQVTLEPVVPGQAVSLSKKLIHLGPSGSPSRTE